ncbi:DUF6386 family protein [Agrobacterium sp. NPDC089420]|uniref:DUF6386 family protein n=1 Tax=Agrobacterium sp. NPDC089420 TaxID=3363918 RepID=UPI00384B2B0A
MRKLIHAITSLLFVAPPAAAADRTIEIDTDVAGFLIFHPDDLAHRAADPIAWYAYSFAYRKESAAGRLLGFGTGADGGFLIRLTMDQPTATEVKFAGARWSYPLIVRHGQVYLDNTDGLPGEEKMDDPGDFPDRWFSLPNGSYRVDVQAIARSQPGAPEELPDYVVSFNPVADIAGIAVAGNLPDLRQAPGWQAKASGSQDAGFGLWQNAEPGARSLPGLATAGDDAVPGLTYQLATTETEYEAYRKAMGTFRVLTFAHQTVGVLAWINGASFMPKRGGRIEFSVETPVMVNGTSADGQVTFDLIPKPDMQATAAEVETFRKVVSKAIQTAQAKPSPFEEERFAALDEPEAVTSWALMHLPLPAGMKIDIYRHGARERIRLITEAIEKQK